MRVQHKSLPRCTVPSRVIGLRRNFLELSQSLRGRGVGKAFSLVTGIPAVVPLRAEVEHSVPYATRMTERLGQCRLLLGGRVETKYVRRVVSHGMCWHTSGIRTFRRRRMERHPQKREGSRSNRFKSHGTCKAFTLVNVRGLHHPLVLSQTLMMNGLAQETHESRTDALSLLPF